jgi:2'-5' RNA ligase
VTREQIDFRVEQVRLYRSHLERSGPRYEVIATAGLGGTKIGSAGDRPDGQFG